MIGVSTETERSDKRVLQLPTGLADGLEVGVLYRREAGCAPGGSSFTNPRRVPRIALGREFGNSSIMRVAVGRPGPDAFVLMNFL